MKFYLGSENDQTTAGEVTPHDLVWEAVKLLRGRGVPEAHIPEWMLKTSGAKKVRETYRNHFSASVLFDLALYVDGSRTEVHSPFRPQHRSEVNDECENAYAASWDQWGVFIAAMFDAADDFGVSLRAASGSAYDWTKTTSFSDSRSLFEFATHEQFDPEHWGSTLDLTECKLHRWESGPSGTRRCKRCGRSHTPVWQVV